MTEIHLARVYDARKGHNRYDEVKTARSGAAEPSVFLVDRVWPRGVAKDALPYDVWAKDVAPSTELRQWFGHDPDKFTEFEKRYRGELDENSENARALVSAARERSIVLLFSAKDVAHNQAVVLRRWINSKK